MARARLLGAGVQGRTSPNPPVGAVVLDADGRLVGEGATAPAGGPHAEVTALTEAGDDARDGTLVVTLEPCDHTGRTGPCTAAILAAGITTVVVAVEDPTDEAAGGAAHLRTEGVDVVTGFETAEAVAGALGPWLHAVRAGRPFVTWKFGATLDGRVAATDRSSRWITGAAARRDVHALRGRVDAVVVGSGTVLVDDPQLTVRDDDGVDAEHQPLRVVLDRRHRVPDTARVLDEAAETVLLDTAVPRFALKALYDRGVRHVLVEGGPTVAGAFVEARLVDEVVGYFAPLLLGSGPSLLADAGVDTLADAVTLAIDSVERVGEDLRVVAHRGTRTPRAGAAARRGERTEPVFTGIVEEVGRVVDVTRDGDGGVLTVAAGTVGDDITHGASIAVNGVCLTVVGWFASGDQQQIRFDVMGETFDRTTVGGLAAGDPVDLERAVRADARLGGHVVQGHVDGTGRIVARTPGSNWELVRFALPADLARYVAEKGSVAVEGVSLTVAAVGVDDAGADWFEVGLIPETLRATVLGSKQPGDPVNLEVDVLAKYTERLLQRGSA